MTKRVVFLLAPRLIDFDSYLPVAMGLNAIRPDWDFRFVTFSRENADYIRRNTTLMAGLEQCATLHCFSATEPGGWLARQGRRLRFFATLAGWILSARRPVLFCGRPFSTPPYALWYFISRLRGGRGFVLFKGRATDDNVQLVGRERLANLPQSSRSLFAPLAGPHYDGLIHYHDQQEMHFYGLRLYGKVSHDRRLKLGLPTLAPPWQRFIEEQAEIERRRLATEGHDLSQDVFAFFPSKAASHRYLRTPTSPADSFRLVMKTLRALKPRALILLRLHPIAQREPFVLDTLAEMADPHIVISLAHPEVLIALSRRVIVNSPTNIQTTSCSGRFIDCTDYSDRHYAELGEVSLTEGYGTVFVKPTGDDFAERLERAIGDDALYEAPAVNAKRQALMDANPPNFDALIRWMEPEGGAV